MKKIKQLSFIIVFALVLSMVAPSFLPVLNDTQKIEAATIVAISKKSISLYVGKTYTLKITGTTNTVKWSSSNKTIATVSTKGKVTAKKKGTATITALVNSKRYTCKVTVKTAATSTATVTPTPTPTTDIAEAALEDIAGMTLGDLKKSFTLTVETKGLSADELYSKGKQYENGDGVVQWYAMAMAYYEAAKTAGNADAATSIESLELYKEKVMSNSPDGQGDIFTFFRTGVTAGQAGEYEKAYAIYYDDAFFFEDPLYRGLGSLADLLRDGSGVKQDVKKAVTLYAFNAKVLGKGNGYTSLGLLYEAKTGTYPGIEQSNDKAMKYFLLSYEGKELKETDFKGPRYAADYYDSGYNHDNGTYMAPDYVKAEAGYIIASKGNGRTFDGTSCYKLGTYYEEGRVGIAQDYAKAAEYYQKAISDPNVHATMLGIPQTYLSLGRFYENGLGVEKDVKTAISYYNKALEAAKENLDLVNAAGNAAAQSVYDEATAALKRLGQ